MLLSSLLVALIAPHAKPAVVSREESARHYFLGVEHECEGEHLHAAWEYTHAVHFDPTNAEAWFARALVFHHCGLGEQAVSDFTRAIRLGPDADAYLHRAYWYAKQKDHRAALADLNKVVELDSRNDVAWRNRGIAHAALGRSDLALADFNRALELDPGSTESLRLRGAIHGKLGGYDKSIRDLSTALATTPDDGEALTWRGISHFAAGDYESASADFASALRLDPANHLAAYNRGLMHAHLGHDLKADADFARAIELKPDDPNAHFQRGELHAKSGDRATAVRSFTRVVELDPRNAVAYRQRARLHSAATDYTAALADLEKVTELEPTAESFKELARLRLDCPDSKLRDAKKAVELADKAWALSRLAATASQPDDFSYAELRASAAAADGDPERAVTILSGLLSSVQPQYPEGLPPTPVFDAAASGDRQRIGDQLERYKRIAELRQPQRKVGVEEVPPAPGGLIARLQQLPPLPPIPPASEAAKSERPPAELPPIPPLSDIGKTPPGGLPPIIIPVIEKN